MPHFRPPLHRLAFGPEIRKARTPAEAVVVDTVEPFFRRIAALVADLCG